MNIEKLNHQFGIKDKVQFDTGNGGFTFIRISTELASATVSLYGAQLLRYQKPGQPELLWMSEQSLYQKGKAIRGGIPLCFPWFGPHPADKTKPQHGFARLEEWQVSNVKELTGKEIKITLGLNENESTLALWPFPFNAVLEIVIDATLTVKLTVTNTGTNDFSYSDALHTYFNIGDIEAVAVEGLQDAAWYDGPGTEQQQQQEPAIRFTTAAETNRRYVNTTAVCHIVDHALNRKIRVSKTGSKVTVIWNPGEATAQTMSDIHPGGFKNFVCVEPANAYPGIDMIDLKPGESHALSTLVEVET